MKKTLFIIITILIKQILFGQGGFSKNYFPTGSIVSVCTDVIEAPNGNIIMTGFTFDGPTGSNRLTIIGADAQGTELWHKDYGNDKFEYLDNYGIYSRSVIKGENCFYFYTAVRDSNNKYFSVFIKFNYNGDTLWQKKYYDSNDYLYIEGVVRSVDNGFLMTGLFGDPVNPITTTMLIKTDSTGVELWRKKIHKVVPDIQEGYNLIQDSLTKKIVITGNQCNGTAAAYTNYGNLIVTDSLGNVLQRKSFGFCTQTFRDLIQTKDKKIVVVGENNQCNGLGGPNGTPRYKGYAVKIDLNNLNNFIWYKEYDTLSIHNRIITVNELPNGDLIFGGHLDTLSNYNLSDKAMLRLIKTDKDGNTKWKKLFSRDDASENSKYIRSLNLTANGSFLTANELYFASNPKPYSITKIDSMGCDSSVFYCQTVGLNENGFNYGLLKIYPNPTNSILNIELENFTSTEKLKIKIIDLLGRIVFESELKSQLDLEEFKTGIYFLQLYNKEKLIAVEKIIKG
ncbi:MAG: T9SS type A sorting domain-containing protein [Bacteroidetes bacterium]|nr:T9SS type A sorting domain-containing protein [Bacteroidota bacterium]